MIKQWVVKNTVKEGTLLERLLTIRGITKPEDVKEFLNPLTTTLTHPNAFVDMPKAVERLAKAVDGGENILIYGDFDADGVTSTSVLLKTFKFLGAKIDFFIPSRESEGHGLNSTALIELMKTKKPKVLVTVDCGISNLDEIAMLKTFGIDVVLTDHHEAPETLPKACAIINPKAQNALSEKLSTTEILHLTALAGVGVAFKLAQALLEHYGKTEFVYEILPFVAVGTVADVVPLIGENRYFVAKGIELICADKHYGIKRLLQEAGYNIENGITSEQIAFGIAPRINAAGRLETVDAAMKVMTSENRQEVEIAVKTLNDFNLIRQELCQQTFAEADEMLEKEGNKDNAIVLFNPSWHVGIVGIVASKLVEKYYKPAFLMTYSEDNNMIRSSARSVEGINLYDVISENAELLAGFGGHAMAAGLFFEKTETSFNEVKTALNKTITHMLAGKTLAPTLAVDLEVEPREVDFQMIEEISRLEPFGAENKAPIFAMRDLILKQKTLMGKNQEHLRLIVQKDEEQFEVVRWSQGDIGLVVGDKLDLAFSPQINVYRGETKLQLRCEDIHSEMLKKEEKQINEIKIYDHRKKTDIFAQVNDYVKSSKLKIKIFAQNKTVLEMLKPYKSLFENACGRQNLEKAESVMFFDYPVSEEDFQNIITKTSPESLHFMNFTVKRIDEKEVLKTLFGMIKFVCNNRNGEFEIKKSAEFLALPEVAVETLLDIFEETGIVKIAEREENSCKITLEQGAELSKALHNQHYGDFTAILDDCQKYQQELLEGKLKA